MIMSYFPTSYFRKQFPKITYKKDRNYLSLMFTYIYSRIAKSKKQNNSVDEKPGSMKLPTNKFYTCFDIIIDFQIPLRKLKLFIIF